MLQFLLILLGVLSPQNNTTANQINQTSITTQKNTDPGEGLDTGGETGQIIPPRK